jgi:hypothetical protein
MQALCRRGAAVGQSRFGASAALFIRFAEVISQDSFFNVGNGAQVLNDIAAGIVKENVALFISSDRDEPFEFVTIFQEIIDRLVRSFAGDNSHFRVYGLFRLGHEGAS